ncbi:MAG: OsmC family protein [Gemmatimonadota bacterium]|nr:OsmC family protein [Gemmatimonadota bacterium]
MDMTIDFPGGMRVDAHVGPHVIHTDQPPDASAPTPFAHFLASIGTCAGVYVLGFCRQRGIDPAGIRVTQRVHGNGRGGVGAVDVAIHLPADFPEKYRAAVVRAADQCAVKEAFRDPPEIRVTALPAPPARPAAAGAGTAA